MGVVCALGSDNAEVAARLFAGDVGRLTPHLLRCTDVEVPVGRVIEELTPLPEHLSRYQCRNHALIQQAYLAIADDVQSLKERVDPRRIGVVLGSSTSGMDATEKAFYAWRETGALPADYDFARQHEMGSAARFVAELAGVRGPAAVVSTACSSSLKSFATASNWLTSGLCDAVLVGGVDTLCDLTLNGFDALELVSRQRSNSMSRNRDGLNIGEGAALFILSRETGAIALKGIGESCDAHHISAPDPDGRGAEAAMRAALNDSGMTPGDIDYINLHGTGTQLNDAAEAAALSRVFPPTVPCSSTKPMTGHCLGAAGAVEAAFCWLTLAAEVAKLPPHCWDGERDEALPEVNLVSSPGEIARPRNVLTNSFAFGGSNCSLVLGLN